jgi:two-component system response regulator RegA
MQSQRHVLVVDDDETILGMYKRCFDASWTVHPASTIEAATEIARGQPLDGAVLDLHVGTTSSVGLIKTVRAANPDVRIIVVSGYLTTEATVACIQAGANNVVDKPVRPREVMERLFAPPAEDVNLADTPTLEEAIDSHVARVFADCGGNISETARRLGIYRSSLQRRLRKNAVKRVD